MFAPTPLRVRLPFRSEDEFVDQYGAHVGRDGFFLATRAPKPVGAQLLFDLVLADGTSLLRGEGVVVRSSATGDRPGMTLRFVRLEAAGKALVERILSGRPVRGGAPAEARAHPSAWAAPAGPAVGAAGPARRDTVPRPAGFHDWAPPGAPARPQPPPEPAASPDESPAAEVSPSDVLESSVASSEVSDTSTASRVPASEASDTSAADTSAAAEVSASEVSDTSGVGASRVESSAAAEVSTSEVSDTSRAEPSATSEVSRSEVSDTSRAEPSAAAEVSASEVSDTSRAEPSAAAMVPDAEPTPAALVETPEVRATPERDGAEAVSAPPDSVRAEVRPTGSPAPEGHDTSAQTRPTPAEPARSDVSSEAVPAGPAADAPVASLEDTSLEAWSARAEREVRGAPEAAPPSDEAPRTAVDSPVPATGRDAAPHPPLDDLEVPELVVTEFKGPGPLRPAGLEHTPASADVHAAITPPAGTLVVTELDEPPPEPQPRFQLDAPVRGDEPLHPPESSFHDVAQALGPQSSPHERPTTPIPLLPTMETAALDEVPIPPPPPPLDVAPIPEEGAVRIEPGPVESPVARAPASETRPVDAPAPESVTPPAAARPTAAGASELGIEINPESIQVCWFRGGRAETLLLDAARGRPEAPVRLVREPGAPPRMLAPDAPDPALWVGAPLSFLGLRAESDASRTVARRWPAAVVPDDRGEAAFALEGGTVGATELVAALLRWVRHRAEELTSHPPGRVVITVPVAFNALQRERLREAAERAGLEGVRLVQAPTAATMAFAHGRGLARRRILVWRMGASTCDIAVLAASGNDLDMVACAGDASLGSVNFDEQIALALDKGARADAGVLRKRIAEAAQLRTQLEDASVAEATLEGARLSRAELEARTAALVERGVLLAREVLRSASLTPDALDELVLVGTAARLPHVRRTIEEAMGRTARTDVDVDSAVSAGAATLAHLLVSAGPKSASRTALHEVLGVPLEIIAPELGQVRVLDRNTRLPAEKTLTVTLGPGTPLEVQVFQGTARAPDPRSFLGLLRAPPDRAGDWTLVLSLDTDGVLRAFATNPSGKRQQLQLQTPAPSAEAETPPPQRVPSEPETPQAPPPQNTGLLGGLKRLFGRR